MNSNIYRKSKEHIRFRELCFDFQFSNDEEKQNIIRELIEMKEKCKHPLERQEMEKSLSAIVRYT